MQGFDGPFRNVVVVGDRAREEAGNAGDAENPAMTLLAQERQRSANDVKHAEDICLKLGADFGFGRLLDRANQSIAGIVEDNVETPELRMGRGDRARDLIGIGDVDGERQHSPAETVGKIGDR